MWVTAGAVAWRKVERVTGDRRISCKLKTLCSARVLPGHAPGTMALTEKQHEKVHVCETNLVRRIVGDKRADKRRMDELRVDVGVK